MANRRSDRLEQALVLPLLLAALLFLVAGALFFISELRSGSTRPVMATGGNVTCIYYGRDGLQCWPEFEDDLELELQGLEIEPAQAPAERVRM